MQAGEIAVLQPGRAIFGNFVVFFLDKTVNNL